MLASPLRSRCHRRGLACEVYESAPEVKGLGVGITLLPHAVHELDALGLLGELEAVAIANRESVDFVRCFHNKLLQFSRNA